MGVEVEGTIVNITEDPPIQINISGSGPAGPGNTPATTSTIGSVALSTEPENAAIPVVVETSDPRMTNARIPLAHKTTHAIGGSDPLSPADIGAATEGALATEKARAESVEATKASTSALTSEIAAREAADKAEKSRAEAAETSKLSKVSNLSDLTSASSARTNLGLGSAATEPKTAFDAAGTAAAEVAGEKARAEGVEVTKANISALSAETSAREAADSTEKARAEASEATKATVTALSTETTAREAADKTEKERAESAENTKLAKASNLSDLASASTARTNLGLGSAATEPKTAFEIAGAAATEKARAEVAEASKATKVELEKVTLGSDWSAGDLVLESPGAIGNVGIKMDIRHGTTAVPITGDGSTIHLSKVSKVTQADHDSWPGVSVGGQTTEQAILSISHLGEEGTEVQVQAANFFARNKGTSGQPDACAFRASAYQYGVGSGVAIGGYIRARSDISGGRLTGLEIQAQNKTGAFVEASNAGFTNVTGLLISAGSSVYEGGGAGIQFHHPSGWAQLDVAIHATSNNGGALKSAFLRDNSEAAVSVDVRGKHSIAAVRVLKESGALLIGAEALSGESPPQLLEVHAGAVNRNPIIKRTGGGNVNMVDAWSNSSGTLNIGIVGSVGGLMLETALGDSTVAASSSKALHLGRSGAKADIKIAGGVTINSPLAVKAEIAMNSNKITGLANGTEVTDAAAFGQIVPASLYDAKGDLLVASADNTPAKLSVGADGTTLVADSTQATGLKWATGPAPAPHAATHQLGGADALFLAQYDRSFGLPGFFAPTNLYPGTTVGPVAKKAYFCRFVPSSNKVIKFIRFIITSGGSGSDPLEVGLYNSSLELLRSSGSKTPGTNSTGVKSVELSSSYEVVANTVYFAALGWGETVTGTPQLAAVLNNSGFYSDIFGTSTLSNRMQLTKTTSFPLPAGPVSSLESNVCPWLVVSEV